MEKLSIYGERITRRWWFFVLFLLAFFLPAYSQQAAPPQDIPKLGLAVLSDPLIQRVAFLFPVFKLLPVLFVAAFWVGFPHTGRW